MKTIKELIDSKNYQGLEQALANNPTLANEGIPYDSVNTTLAHPLHRLCDGVFSGTYTDAEAVQMARIFLAHRANINGNDELIEKQDTPLVAAASLHADQVAILYIENGADLNHAGCYGGTALHWAAWCGRAQVVEKLVQQGAKINKICIDFTATPLFWAVHGLKNGGATSSSNYLECVRILVQAGADKSIPNCDGNIPLELLDDGDLELKELLNGAK